MKTEIKLDGFIHITAETELEGYALNKWGADEVKKDGTNIIIHCKPVDKPDVPSDGGSNEG